MILTLFVAAIHAYIVFLEMVAWESPAARRAFGTTIEFASASKVLAGNQGLYNGFIVAGLVVALWWPDPVMQVYLLACVGVAGLYGALTVSRKILLVQSLPAGLALVAMAMKV